MKKFLKDMSFIFFPPSSKRGKWLKRTAIRLGLTKSYIYDHHYQFWIETSERFMFLDPIKNKDLKFSIIVPAYNTKDKYLEPLIYSILNQSYNNFELIIGDASDIPKRVNAIKNISKRDKRIKYVRLGKNEGISINTNKCLDHVSGDWTVFMDHDDTLSVHALNEVAIKIKEISGVEILYSDEDKLTDSGLYRHTPHFKPDWSPHQYLSCNWTSHLSVIRTDLVKKVKGLRAVCDGAQDYDLVLRLLALPGERQIVHIPKILYHWRVAEGSTADNFLKKDYAVKAGMKALNDFLKAKEIKGKAKPIDNRPGFYDIDFTVNKEQQALIIVNASKDLIMNKTVINQIKRSSSSITKTIFITKDEFDNNPKKYLDKLYKDDVIFSINGNYTVNKTKWVDTLCGVLNMENVRAVMPKIIWPDQTIKDMGIILEAEKETPLFKHLHCGAGTIFGHTEWIRDVVRVSGSFFAAKKETWVNLNKDGISQLIDENKKYDVVWSNIIAVSVDKKPGSYQGYNPNLVTDKYSRVPRV
jgi:glycosyltransferase involved in cell wall biosynthesis